jgi:hypothetical protein
VGALPRPRRSGTVVEHFLVASWAEHLRQHHQDTASSDAMLRRLSQFIDPTIQVVDHLISTRSPGSWNPHIAQAVEEGFADEI